MWGRHIQGRELVRRTCEALGPEVRVMPLKGILLGALGVVDPADRPISDVDLLVFGMSLGAITATLSRARYALMDVPIARGYLSLLADDNPSISLDVHVVLMPFAQGRLGPNYLLEGARLRDDLFGVPVWVPTREKLVVHAIANIIKDRVVHAHPHTARDLAALLAPFSREALAGIVMQLANLSLLGSAAIAVAWARTLDDSGAIRELFEQLVSPGEREQVASHVQQLSAADHFDLRARVRARACADSPMLRLLAPMAAGLDTVSWPWRFAWLHTLERWHGRRAAR